MVFDGLTKIIEDITEIGKTDPMLLRKKGINFSIIKLSKMKSKPIIVIASLTLITATVLLIASCGNGDQKTDQQTSTTDASATTSQTAEVHGTQIQPGDITLDHPLKKDWVSAGKGTYELKCQSCHKLTTDRLVGPGWKDVTKRRKPEWIMNMITNVDMMLETDPEAQKLLEQCLVRMPMQNLSKDQAREVLEFMRENDGEK